MRTVSLDEDLAALIEGEKPLDEAAREALVIDLFRRRKISTGKGTVVVTRTEAYREAVWVRDDDGAENRIAYDEHRLGDVLLSSLSEPLRRQACDFVEFHCMLLRTDLFGRIGPLDELTGEQDRFRDVELVVLVLVDDPASVHAVLGVDVLEVRVGPAPDGAVRRGGARQARDGWSRAVASPAAAW